MDANPIFWKGSAVRRSIQTRSVAHRSVEGRSLCDFDNPDHRVILIVILLVTAASMFVGTYIQLRRISTSVAASICVVLCGQMLIRWARRARQVRKNRELLERRALDDAYNHQLAQFKMMATIEQMMALSPEGFERFVLRYFRFAGFEAEMTPPNHDGGIDGVVRRGAFTGLVQCKRYARPICQRPVREFLGVLAKTRADVGFFVTTSTFGRGARSFAEGTILTLIDGETLSSLILRLPYVDPTTGRPLRICTTQEKLEAPAFAPRMLTHDRSH